MNTPTNADPERAPASAPPAEGFYISDKCRFCGEYGAKVRPYVCEQCWGLAVELVAKDRSAAGTKDTPTPTPPAAAQEPLVEAAQQLVSHAAALAQERDKWHAARDECERQFQAKVEEIVRLTAERDSWNASFHAANKERLRLIVERDKAIAALREAREFVASRALGQTLTHSSDQLLKRIDAALGLWQKDGEA